MGLNGFRGEDFAIFLINRALLLFFDQIHFIIILFNASGIEFKVFPNPMIVYGTILFLYLMVS